MHRLLLSAFAITSLAMGSEGLASASPESDFLNATHETCDARKAQLSYLKVPALRSDPVHTLNLAYWIRKAKNPTDDYLLMIPGGPGQTFFGSEWTPLEHINLVYFDPRGVGCSMPDQPEVLASPDFNTSAGIIRDVEALRVHLGIRSWFVYAHSYGTVPATMYAHQFPASIRKLVLEGSIAAGGARLWSPAGTNELFARAWNSLSPATREQALPLLSSSPWFSKLLLMALPQNSGIDEVEERVERFLKHPRLSLPPPEADPQDIPGVFASRPYLYISCNELGADEYSVERLYSFDGQSTAPWATDSLKLICRKYKNQEPRFDASANPISVPLLFFHGENDVITSQTEAMRRFQWTKTTNPRASFFSLKKGGHNPLSLALATFNAESPAQNISMDFLESLLRNPSEPDPQSIIPWQKKFLPIGFDWTYITTP